jgi:hypothetical protein
MPQSEGRKEKNNTFSQASKGKSNITSTPNVTIELHAPTSSTKKLKLTRKGGQFTYTPTVTNFTDTCHSPQGMSRPYQIHYLCTLVWQLIENRSEQHNIGIQYS